jgi:uncharacterized protein
LLLILADSQNLNPSRVFPGGNLMNMNLELPEEFDGEVKLFPLPNLVFFPHVVQPLHIFEPRYRDLMLDALNDDRLITLACLKEGDDNSTKARPPIHSIVTIGRIHKEERLEDGRWNLFLLGLCRAKILEEMDTDKRYRSARVEILADIPVSSEKESVHLRQKIEAMLEKKFADQPLALTQLKQLVCGDSPLGSICDILGFALPLPVELKVQMLNELSVLNRIHLLLGYFEGTQPGRKWPPEFSIN